MSLAQKIIQQVHDEKTQKVHKFKRLKDDNTTKPTPKKVPKIKLVPKTNGKETPESWILSSDRDRVLNSSPARREHSPEIDLMHSKSQNSTTSISPKEVAISSRDRGIDDRESPELSYFGMTRDFKVPKLALKRPTKARENGSYVNQQEALSYDAGFMSERGLKSKTGKMNESVDSARKSVKLRVPKQLKRTSPDIERIEVHREMRKIVNPHNSQDNTPEIIKKTNWMQWLDKEDSIKHQSKGLNTSREAKNNKKMGYSAMHTGMKSTERPSYTKSKDKIIERKTVKGHTFADFDYDEEHGKSSLESVEEWNRDSL